jgi:hypothetical protein
MAYDDFQHNTMLNWINSHRDGMTSISFADRMAWIGFADVDLPISPASRKCIEYLKHMGMPFKSEFKPPLPTKSSDIHRAIEIINTLESCDMDSICDTVN